MARTSEKSDGEAPCPHDEDDKLTRCEVISYGHGHVFNDSYTVVFSYSMMYLNSVGFDESSTGTFMLLSMLAIALGTNVASVLADRVVGCRALGLGRRKWLYSIATVLMGVMLLLCFAVNLADVVSSPAPSTVVAYYTGTNAVCSVCWAIIQVAHMALVPELTRDPRQQMTLNTVRFAATAIVSIAVSSAFLPIVALIQLEDERTSRRRQVNAMALVAVVVGTLASWIFLRGTPERMSTPAVHRGQQQSAQPLMEEHVELHADLAQSIRSLGVRKSAHSRKHAPPRVPTTRDWLRMLRFYVVTVIYLLCRVHLLLFQVYMLQYIDSSLAVSDTILAIAPLAVYAGSLAASGVLPVLVERAGKRGVLVGGCLAGGAGSALLLFTKGLESGWRLPATLLAGCALTGAGNSAVVVISVCLQADLIGSDIEAGTFIYGTISFLDKVFSGILIFALQLLGDSGVLDATFTGVACIPLAAIAVACVIGGVLPKKWMLPRTLDRDAPLDGDMQLAMERRRAVVRVGSVVSVANQLAASAHGQLNATFARSVMPSVLQLNLRREEALMQSAVALRSFGERGSSVAGSVAPPTASVYCASVMEEAVED